MMKSLFIRMVIVFIFSSCTQQQSLDGYYMGAVGKDSVFLTIHNIDNRVTGNLHYRFWEKDQNSGTVSGQVMQDSLLLLDYQFMSEGMQSVRQATFLIKDGKLIEGYGEMEERNGMLKFSDIQQLNFGSSFELQPVACE